MTVSPQTVAGALSGAASSVDLTNCDREPIHVPGSIQPHGFLLALAGSAVAPADLAVVQASTSAATYQWRPLEASVI